MLTFKQKVLEATKLIKEGEFTTYQKIAQVLGNKKSQRAVGNILAKNRDPKIPCHRVIKNDGLVGGYKGKKDLSWLKLGLLLKEGVVAVMPTDTLYGICGTALKRKTVERIYRLRRRTPDKPMIILISKLADLKIFKINLSKKEEKILKRIWPGKISVILPCNKTKFKYLHRGTKSLAFRLPKDKFLNDVLKISGPLVAPSANWEGELPAKTINKAKRYFGNKIVYFDGGKITSQPSTLLSLKNGQLELIRKGEDWEKIQHQVLNR